MLRAAALEDLNIYLSGRTTVNIKWDNIWKSALQTALIRRL